MELDGTKKREREVIKKWSGLLGRGELGREPLN